MVSCIIQNLIKILFLTHKTLKYQVPAINSTLSFKSCALGSRITCGSHKSPKVEWEAEPSAIKFLSRGTIFHCCFRRQTPSLHLKVGLQVSFLMKLIIRASTGSKLCCHRCRLLRDFPWCTELLTLSICMYTSLLIACHWLGFSPGVYVLSELVGSHRWWTCLSLTFIIIIINIIIHISNSFLLLCAAVNSCTVCGGTWWQMHRTKHPIVAQLDLGQVNKCASHWHQSINTIVVHELSTHSGHLMWGIVHCPVPGGTQGSLHQHFL